MGYENGGRVLRCDSCEKRIERADAVVTKVTTEKQEAMGIPEEYWVECKACAEWNAEHGIHEEADRLFGRDEPEEGES